MSKKQALDIMLMYSNQHKRTYVRIGERVSMLDTKIDGTDMVLRMHTRVYSKTWSKTTARLIVDGEALAINRARKYLTA